MAAGENNLNDELEALLRDGWNVEGYSVCMMSMGALSHHILLRRDYELRSVAIISNQGKEIGRNPSMQFSPMPQPPQKKGFFG